MPSAGQQIRAPKDIHACLVCDLATADQTSVYLSDGVLK
jgi:hypothetical protein